jgi:formate-dependent phosphoribosylglycinamide formyltransferase (GAR transformylase)
MIRSHRIDAICGLIGDRRLVWFGIRGDDAAGYLPIPQFRSSFSINAPLSAAKLDASTSLEEMTGRRVDLDAYDIDFDEREVVHEFRRQVLARLSSPSVVVTYRPSHFLSALTFACQRHTENLGMFKERQTAFEHKPWVESALASMGLRTIPWEYVPTEHRAYVAHLLEDGPVILRPTKTSGGVGIELAHTLEDVARSWQDDTNHLMCIAPYLAGALPLNVGGCVYDATTVTLHPMSVQLIGVDKLTHRPFGYCGNDFASIRHLSADLVDEIDASTRAIGRWLGSMGFRGAFGVDFLVHEGLAYFAEINPRMQGSTRMAVQLSQQIERVDLCLDHLSVFLGLPPAESLHLRDWASELPPAAQAILHNTVNRPVTYAESTYQPAVAPARVSLVPHPSVEVEPGAVLARLEYDRTITTSGYALDL